MSNLSLILPSSPIIEVASSLSSRQLSLLINGPKYVPPCQSRFSGKSVEDIVKQEWEIIIDSFKNGLSDNCVSASDQRAKEFFNAIEHLLRRLYTTPLSHKLFHRAQYEHRLVKSIQSQLSKSKVVLRRTDKSKVFHLGHIDDYRRKALKYMQTTNAYKELPNGINPAVDHLRTVLALIDPLLKKKAINLEQWKLNMRPNTNTTELAHLYFVPKPHKVNCEIKPGKK